jgi:methyl-accepting chemotaxis protein
LRSYTFSGFKEISWRFENIYGFSKLMNEHYSFVDSIESQLYSGNHIDVNSDPRKCNIYSFINSASFQERINKYSELQQKIARFDSLHKLLHYDVVILNNYLSDTTLGKWVAINYFQSHTKKLSRKLQKVASEIEDYMLSQNIVSKKKLFLSNLIGFLLMVTALFILMILSFRAYISLNKSVKSFEKQVQRLAQGDLSIKFNIGTKDELNQIAEILNQGYLPF